MKLVLAFGVVGGVCVRIKSNGSTVARFLSIVGVTFLFAGH
jgi:hypothetical protein